MLFLWSENNQTCIWLKKKNKITLYFNVQIPLGEQIQPVRFSPEDFEQQWKKLGGMNRHAAKLDKEIEAEQLMGRVNVHKINQKVVFFLILNKF